MAVADHQRIHPVDLEAGRNRPSAPLVPSGSFQSDKGDPAQRASNQQQQHQQRGHGGYGHGPLPPPPRHGLYRWWWSPPHSSSITTRRLVYSTQLLPLRPMLLLRLHARDRRQLPTRGDTSSADASAASIVVAGDHATTRERSLPTEMEPSALLRCFCLR